MFIFVGTYYENRFGFTDALVGMGAFLSAASNAPVMAVMMIVMIPLTRVLAGTSLGVEGAVPPLVASAAPFFARLVENVLREHPGVREAAVFGVPDPDWGQRVCAAVVPDPGVAGVLEGERGPGVAERGPHPRPHPAAAADEGASVRRCGCGRVRLVRRLARNPPASGRPQAERPDRRAVAGGVRAPGGRLVAALGDHLAQAEPDAGERHRPLHQVP